MRVLQGLGFLLLATSLTWAQSSGSNNAPATGTPDIAGELKQMREALASQQQQIAEQQKQIAQQQLEIEKLRQQHGYDGASASVAGGTPKLTNAALRTPATPTATVALSTASSQ